MPAGRPPMYETPEEMQPVIDAYFAECDVGGKPYTMAGLTRALGFSHRQSIADYEAKPDFTDTIKKARLRVEEFLECRLYGQSVAGVIFNLKNNFGWKDRQEISGPDGGPIEHKDVSARELVAGRIAGAAARGTAGEDTR